MLRWSPGAVKATVGVGALGLMVLLMELFDRFGVKLPFPALFVLAFTPMMVFVFTGDSFGRRWAERAQWIAIGWYGVATLVSLVGLAMRGLARHDLFFLAFVAVGAWPCIVAARGLLHGDPASSPDGLPTPGFDARHAPGERRVRLAGVAGKSLRLLVIALVFVAIGLTPAFQREHPVAAWAGVAFFGLGAVFALLRLTWPAARGSLTLDPQGFEIDSFGRRHRFRWSDVVAFGLVRLHGTSMVSIAYAPTYAGQRTGRRMAAGLTGIEGAIPDQYEVSGPALVALLEAWRGRFGQASDTSSSGSGAGAV